jgi:histone deacetylase 11
MLKKIDRRKFLLALTALAGLAPASELMRDVVDDTLALDQKNLQSKLKVDRVPLIYRANYNISLFGLEKFHPFDGCKFARIEEKICATGLRGKDDFLKPMMISGDELLTVHTSKYLEDLKNSYLLSRIFEIGALAKVPAHLIDWRVLRPMRYASGGTLLACREALTNGLAINLGGGYHHADRDHGGGFCVYSDIPVALNILHQEGKIKRALVVDTDAHQGNGFANVMRGSGWAFGLDIFDESIYPFPKVTEDISLPLPFRTGGEQYLTLLEKMLPVAIERFKPDFIAYNAGSDVLASDPLSSLQLTMKDMSERDLMVVSQARKAGVPLAMVLAGGYSKESAAAHAQSIEGLLRKFDTKGA